MVNLKQLMLIIVTASVGLASFQTVAASADNNVQADNSAPAENRLENAKSENPAAETVKPATTPKIVVMGLFTNSAVVQIDGHERILKLGKASPEGVVLISATSKSAQVEVNGVRQTLLLNRGIGTRFSEAPVTEVRIASQVNGHYVTPGRINNKAVEFLVDTGATSIAMNANTAQALGVSFSGAKAVMVQTAQGSTKAFQVVLDSVSVGNLEVYSTEALVIDGEFPKTILLGNTFLSRVDLKVEQGVMVLQTKY